MPDRVTQTGSRYRLANKQVWRVGYGGMQLAGDGVFGPPRDRGEAIAVLRAAADAGVDHIDTAQYYGPGTAIRLFASPTVRSGAKTNTTTSTATPTDRKSTFRMGRCTLKG
jgi:aryl-alcohol dehydrogenase-like predicted oxidoreductase